MPEARGDGARIVQEAEAYRQQVVLQAQGDAARFLSVYESYKASEDVTARRLYIETMESVLKNTNKIILDKGGGRLGRGALSAAAAASPAPRPGAAPARPRPNRRRGAGGRGR